MERKGLVYKSTGSWYTVRDQQTGEVYECKIKGRLRMDGIKATNPVAVGDYVNLEIQEGQTAQIIQIFPRKNYIIRRSSNLSKQYHIIASNIDQAILVVSLISPETPLAFIDRFLMSAEAYRVPVVIVFNKSDLWNEEFHAMAKYLVCEYEKIGYKCLITSIKKQDSVAKLHDLLRGKISVVNGNSGVGKSKLINFINPDLKLKIGDISNQHQTGKHTTTFAQMYQLDEDSLIIDTPGIRGFGTLEMQKSEIYHFFPEIFKASRDCKFHNCLHIEEPDCNVKKLVETGEISNFRYTNYLSVYYEDKNKYRT